MADLIDISVLNDISEFWPESEYIKQCIRGIERDIQSDKPACMDSAKCLLESVCKTVIHENGLLPSSDKIHLNKLFSEALTALGIVRAAATDVETELFNALVKSIEQVGRYRNHYGAVAHGRVANCEKLSDDICIMAISTLLSGCLIIFREHKNQSDVNSDIRYSLRPYEAFSGYNDIVDDNSQAGIDDEQAEVILNGSIRFRYSEILFALDREAYADIISSVGNGP